MATDTRLWLYGALGQTRGYLADLIKAAVARAEADADVLMPGFTHLQPAQVCCAVQRHIPDVACSCSRARHAGKVLRIMRMLLASS